MKHTVRSFSIGLLTAGVIMLIGFYFFDTEPAQTKDLTVDEMVPLAEEEGYRIISEEDYISLSVRRDHSSDNEETEEEAEVAVEDEEAAEEPDENGEAEENTDDNGNDDAEEETEEASEEEITTYTLHIEEGMTSSEFSSLLEENNIVEDASEFNQYIEDEDYSLRVQIGEFELTSDMSIYEIAEEITR